MQAELLNVYTLLSLAKSVPSYCWITVSDILIWDQDMMSLYLIKTMVIILIRILMVEITPFIQNPPIYLKVQWFKETQLSCDKFNQISTPSCRKYMGSVIWGTSSKNTVYHVLHHYVRYKIKITPPCLQEQLEHC